MSNLDLFERYPNVPGHRGIDTSITAAEGIKPKSKILRQTVLDALSDYGPMSTLEICMVTNEEYSNIQPRTSELKAKGEIEDTGTRRKTPSGKLGIVWGLG